MYSPSILEKQIAIAMEEMGILTPQDIDIETICFKRNIHYEETPLPSHYIMTNNEKYIFVNNRLSEEKKKEHFFHELAHITLHSGLQTSLSKEHCFVQERDARNFTKYALIPFHTLSHINWYSDFIVEEVMETFQVSEKISMERLTGIKSNLLMNCVSMT